MICRILLLIILTSCVSAGSFVVNVTQSSYQAEENHNITLEWTFTTNPDKSPQNISIVCHQRSCRKNHTVFLNRVGDGVSELEDEKFSERVQSDKDALREGRIRLELFRLRPDDSGLYICKVITSYGSGSASCQLEVTAGSFVVNVTQGSYQAGENENITLEWKFTTNPDRSWEYICIFCQVITDNEVSILYDAYNGAEISASQDKRFSGRVQSDKDALRKGQLRLQLYELRTEDSGRYNCKVRTNYGSGSASCRLDVRELFENPQTQRPTISSQPESRDQLGLGLSTAAFLFVCALFCFALVKKNMIQTLMLNVSESQPIRTNRTPSRRPIFYHDESFELQLKT